MDRFEELKQKYANVLNTIRSQGVRLAHLNLQENRLYLQGAAPNEGAKNAVWNQIKAINPACDDIAADISIDSSLPQPAAASPPRRTYTVKAGDTLSRIAKEFYGNPNDYMRIFDANKDKLADPDEIEAGQELVIPGNR